MTREQQFNLIKELRAVLTERGLTQKELAAHIGTSAGTLSAVFSLKGQMREERWRMACEFCSLDFDALMGYAKAPPVQSSPVQSSPVQTEPEEKEEDPVNPLTPVQCRLLADYIEETLPDAIGTLDDVSYAMISDLVALHDQLMEGAKAVHERS